VARGPCWRPARIRRNTPPKRFVLGLVQVSDLERITQFRDARRWRIEQVVCFRSDADGPSLDCGIFVCQETEIKVSRLSAVESETVSALGWIRFHEVLQE